MDMFIKGFCHLLSGQYPENQVNEIGELLDKYALNFNIEPSHITTDQSEYTIPYEYELYIAEKKQNGKMSERTYEQYDSCLKKMLYGIALPLNDITSKHLRMHICNISTDKRTGKPLAQATINQRKSIIRSFFQWLADEDYIEKDPSTKLKQARPNSKPREPYIDTQIEMIRDACVCSRDKAIIDIFLSTGIRVSELCSLNKSDIDFERREMRVLGKGKKWRTVYLDARAVVSLRKYFASREDNNEAMFVCQKKPYERLRAGGVRCIMRKISKDTNISNVIPHKFRHTMATTAMCNGMPVESVQDILGHAELATTMRYAHISHAKTKRDYEMYMCR